MRQEPVEAIWSQNASIVERFGTSCLVSPAACRRPSSCFLVGLMP